jgi:hypothetical protein
MKSSNSGALMKSMKRMFKKTVSLLWVILFFTLDPLHNSRLLQMVEWAAGAANGIDLPE